ncbi:MAG: hypothetical protein SFU99_04990, partial [Saprospiraceae bacterium]|nr:hypothetical protein [Saprospiraceae bacterium]
MTKFLVQLVMSLKALWRFLKVDNEHLEAILTAKLTMDTRRTRSFQQSHSQQKKNQAWLPVFLYFIMGLLFMFFVTIFEDRMTGLTIYFAAFMVMFAMTLITDFTDVLIDVRDNFIILPRPVDDRTITVARVLHIFLYLFSLLVPYVTPSAIYLLIVDGVSGFFIFLLQVLLSVLFVIFIVNLLYLFILQITSPRRFREIINYFQIVFSILIFGCYYLLPRIIDFADFKGASIIESAAAPFIPPVWIASLWPLIIEGKTTFIYWMMSVMAILTPLICIYLVGAVLAKNFNQKMMAIGEGSREETVEAVKKAARKNSQMQWLSSKLCASPAEQVGFEWIWMMTQRSRDYKLRVYPSLGIIIIYFIYFLLQGRGNLQERITEMQGGYSYLIMIYFSSLVILGAL